MGFGKRLWALLVGKTDRAVEDEEKRDPDAVYRAVILEEENKLRQIRELVRETKGLEFSISEKITGLQKTKGELTNSLELAKKTAVEGTEADKAQAIKIGTRLVEQIDTLTAQIADQQAALTEAQKQSTEIIEARDEQEKHLTDLKAEQANAKNIIATDSILRTILDRKQGIGLSSSDKSLENARAAVNAAKANHAGTAAEVETSFEHQLGAFTKQSKTAAAEEKFKAMLGGK